MTDDLHYNYFERMAEALRLYHGSPQHTADTNQLLRNQGYSDEHIAEMRRDEAARNGTPLPSEPCDEQEAE